MRVTVLILGMLCCLTSSNVLCAPDGIEFGVGAGLAYCPKVEASLSRLWPEYEAFVAWPRGESQEFRVEAHWLCVERFLDEFRGEPDTYPVGSRSVSAAAGQVPYVRSEAVDVVDVRFASVWHDQTTTWLHTYAGVGLGLAGAFFEADPSEVGFLVAPIFGATVYPCGLPLGIETGGELVVAHRERARFGVVPLRVAIGF